MSASANFLEALSIFDSGSDKVKTYLDNIGALDDPTGYDYNNKISEANEVLPSKAITENITDGIDDSGYVNIKHKYVNTAFDNSSMVVDKVPIDTRFADDYERAPVQKIDVSAVLAYLDDYKTNLQGLRTDLTSVINNLRASVDEVEITTPNITLEYTKTYVDSELVLLVTDYLMGTLRKNTIYQDLFENVLPQELDKLHTIMYDHLSVGSGFVINKYLLQCYSPQFFDTRETWMKQDKLTDFDLLIQKFDEALAKQKIDIEQLQVDFTKHINTVQNKWQEMLINAEVTVMKKRLQIVSEYLDDYVRYITAYIDLLSFVRFYFESFSLVEQINAAMLEENTQQFKKLLIDEQFSIDRGKLHFEEFESRLKALKLQDSIYRKEVDLLVKESKSDVKANVQTTAIDLIKHKAQIDIYQASVSKASGLIGSLKEDLQAFKTHISTEAARLKQYEANATAAGQASINGAKLLGTLINQATINLETNKR